jgi:hypothetical protein
MADESSRHPLRFHCIAVDADETGQAFCREIAMRFGGRLRQIQSHQFNQEKDANQVPDTARKIADPQH